ncbi:unnamed protein product [Gulo gulo]|uniref:Uncharacterized protein n=1 Tax=Gulo gulo TaxID=48420 RepID=A0A9X9Q362_GULGU|nr:unnamed protein product [Gulo gulo]
MRMSFITYSTQGHTLMELTSDRSGLLVLQMLVMADAEVWALFPWRRRQQCCQSDYCSEHRTTDAKGI